MRCPNDDAELIQHSHTDPKGLRITYSQCPTCGGTWLDAFNANYIKTDDIRTKEAPAATLPKLIHPACPQCQEKLSIYHGENLPQDVQTWKCPNGHGYFFPKGELFKFKIAQEAKISYFKLWHVPFPAVASMLLVSLVLAVSLGVTLTYVSRQQTTLIQAREFIRFQQAYVADRSVTVALTTTAATRVVTLHVGNWRQQMQTTDHLLHTAFLTNLTPGTYEYYYTFTAEGKTFRSDTYRFIIL